MIWVNYEQFGKVTKLYSYQSDGFDGKHGITSVEGLITLKDNTEALINAMEPKSSVHIFAGASLTSEVYSDKGEYSKINLVGIAANYETTKEELLKVGSAGKAFYQVLPGVCSEVLSK